jgi:histidinol-phosphate phosphatase family protein
VFRAVFLDRDGVITEDPPHYAHKLSDLKLVPRSAEAIKLLNQHNFKVIIISNQSGIARGYYAEADWITFNEGMYQELRKAGANIDAAYCCPHKPEDNCSCRKPKPGMIIQAANDFNIHIKDSYMIGDKLSDIEAGQNVGCKESILVQTGKGCEEAKQHTSHSDDKTVADLYDAVAYILRFKR